MPIIIDILIFFGFIGTAAWAVLRNTAKTVSSGVKEKMSNWENKRTNDELSYLEKEAIISSLLYVCMADTYFHPDKHACLKQIAGDIDFKFDLYKLLQNNSPNKSMTILSNLTEKNKDLFIAYSYGITHCTAGGATFNEIARNEQLYKAAGISEERVSRVVSMINMMA